MWYVLSSTVDDDCKCCPGIKMVSTVLVNMEEDVATEFTHVQNT